LGGFAKIILAKGIDKWGMAVYTGFVWEVLSLKIRNNLENQPK